MNLKSYLPVRQSEGRHDITILDASIHKESKETVVYRVSYQDETGAQGQQFYTVLQSRTKGAGRIFASLCALCGLSDEQLEDFDPSMLSGCRLNVNLEENEQGFMVIKSFKALG